MNDLKTKDDIRQLVEAFYAKAKKDGLIAHFFNEVVVFEWEEHIPMVVSFWEKILLGNGNYQGNPMTKHIALNQLSPIKKVHFERWLEIWGNTINELFEGEKAEEAKERAKSIAAIMQFKLNA